jgi:lysophospholipase L1-like esterase
MKITSFNFTIILALLLLPLLPYAQSVLRFDFGEGESMNNFIKVRPSDTLKASASYGFHGGQGLYAKKTGEAGTPEDDYISSSSPFFYSVKLPEGNYNVTIVTGDAQGTSDICVKAECRRFMVQEVKTEEGKFKKLLFTVHIRDSLINNKESVKLKPREKSYFHWDNWLTLEFNGREPKVCSVEIAKVDNIPTIFLAGNSTVVDQAIEPWAAWGQMLPMFLKPFKVVVANYAESGETLLAFNREKRLNKIWSMAKPGDYLFIEFAHNDQKPGGNYLDPFTTYKQTLKEWIAECRRREITPVMVTSMHRRSFDSLSGKIINTLGDYPEAMRQVAKEENVVLLDLNDMSKKLYEAWGPEQSKKAFVHYPPNTFPDQPEALHDDTHFNSYGAYELCKCVVQAIKESKLPLKNFIVKSFTSFDPDHPDAFEAVYLPASPLGEVIKPDGN